MKSLALTLTTILTLYQLPPTLQNEVTTNYELEPLYLIQPNFLTTSINDVLEYLTKNDFQQKVTLGFVAKNSRDCNGNASLIPVYRFYNHIVQKYILSTNQSPPNETTLAYVPDGVAFYASSKLNERCGLTVPLHSYWVNTYYVYTTDKSSADEVLVQRNGGAYKGIVCYISANDEPVTTTTAPITTPIYKIFQVDPAEARTDYLEIPKNFTRAPDKLVSTSPAVIEVVIVVDKAFGDLFQQNYHKIADYLTIYFWDVNNKFKTLWNVDLSIRVNGLLTMNSPGAQPFIENAKASDGRTEHGRTLNSFKHWIYQQRSWLVRHDMAILMTNAKSEWSGGLTWLGGACAVDTNSGLDYGTAVWNDDGAFSSVGIATHVMAHNVGASHDDDSSSNCSGPHGFIMSGGNDERRYFFQNCSDAAISAYVNSDRGACLRRYDGYETTSIDTLFSLHKAGTMQEMCTKAVNNVNAWIDVADTFNCKNVFCKRRDDSNPNVIWMHSVSPIDNIQCGNGGRCFRGKCRPESKLLRNEGSGYCLGTNSRFGFMVPARMFKCPSLKDRTPLETLEIRNVPNGKLLASPFLHDENKESGDRCFYTGNADGDGLWTDRCSTENPWHVWEFRPINGDQNRFQLVHKLSGRCVSVKSNACHTVKSVSACTTDSSMVWSWVDGV